MADASWLERAMTEAGYENNSALAEDAGVSSATIARVLKTGRCNSKTAEKIQEACGEHAIGPLMQPRTPSREERVEGSEEAGAVEEVFDGDVWFTEERHGRLIAVGTRLDESSEGAGKLTNWGAAVFEDGGTRQVACRFGYSSMWPARDWARSVAAGGSGPVERDAQRHPVREG